MLKLQHQISNAWELDEVLFFFLILFLSLESFPCLASSSFAAAGGCVASRCWWIAANGSSWNCGLFSTAFRWADSRSLQNRVGFLIQNPRWNQPRPESEEARCQQRITLKPVLTCSSASHQFCAQVQLVLEGTRRVLKDRMLSVFSDDDSGSFSAQELKLRMNNATSHRTKTKKTKLQT